MKLPLEVRNQIYKILISSMFGEMPDLPRVSSPHGICFTIKEKNWEEEDDDNFEYATRRHYAADDIERIERTEDYYLNAYKEEDVAKVPRFPRSCTEAHQDIESEAAFTTDSDVTNSDTTTYYTANSDFESVDSGWETVDSSEEDNNRRPNYDSLDYQVQLAMPDIAPDYQFIRKLSHVSQQFSREVGQCLWENSVLKIRNLAFLFSFAENYPSTLRHIRGLVLDVLWEDDFLDTSTSILEAVFELINRHMNLRFITIGFTTRKCLVEDYRDGSWEGLATCTHIFSGSTPSEKFQVSPRISCHDDVYTEGSLCEVVKEALEEEWMPDCLRATSDIASYIEGRKELAGA